MEHPAPKHSSKEKPYHNSLPSPNIMMKVSPTPVIPNPYKNPHSSTNWATSQSFTCHIKYEMIVNLQKVADTFSGNTKRALDYFSPNQQNPMTSGLPRKGLSHILNIQFETWCCSLFKGSLFWTCPWSMYLYSPRLCLDLWIWNERIWHYSFKENNSNLDLTVDMEFKIEFASFLVID